MARAVLITGGNLGPVAENLSEARRLLGLRAGTVERCSSVMESAAWGFEAGEPFLNQALVVRTALPPEALLDACQRIERELGRVRVCGEGYRSRTMDIDILFYDDRIIRTGRLTVPHPLIDRRDFVLAPLEEIMPDYVHPALGKTIGRLRAELKASGTDGTK